MGNASFDATIVSLYEAVTDFHAWPAALETLADHVGGLGAMLVYNDLERAQGLLVTGRLREDLGFTYLDHYVKNPWTMRIAEVGPTDRPFLVNALLDRTIVPRTAFYADILEPQRIVDQIIYKHPAFATETAAGGFGVVLSEDQLEDASQALDRMARLLPHLARALDLSVDLERYREDMRARGCLLDALPAAALLLDQKGRLLQANPRAEQMLAAADGLTLGQDGCIHAVMSAEDRRLQAALADTRALATGVRDGRDRYALGLQRRSGLSPLLLLFTPLPEPANRLPVFDERACLLVKIIDPTERISGSASKLREAFGLTHAEARVAELVASGLPSPAIASVLGVAPTTVRTHLARCFDKTGTHSQVTLARLVGDFSA